MNDCITFAILADTQLGLFSTSVRSLISKEKTEKKKDLCAVDSGDTIVIKPKHNLLKQHQSVLAGL